MESRRRLAKVDASQFAEAAASQLAEMFFGDAAHDVEELECEEEIREILKKVFKDLATS